MAATPLSPRRGGTRSAELTRAVADGTFLEFFEACGKCPRPSHAPCYAMFSLRETAKLFSALLGQVACASSTSSSRSRRRRGDLDGNERLLEAGAAGPFGHVPEEASQVRAALPASLGLYMEIMVALGPGADDDG